MIYWLLHLFFEAIIFWFIMRKFVSYIKTDKLKYKQYELENNNNTNNNTNNNIVTDNYDLEKVYAIKINYIGIDYPKISLPDGFVWFNTENNTINIYHDNNFHEYPVLHKSLIKRYIKRNKKN